MRRRVIIVTSLIVGALILALMLWMEPVVGVDEVEVLLGLRTGIDQMSNISIDFTSHVGLHGFKCLLGTHLLIMFYSLCEQIHLSYKHVNFFNWMHTSFTGWSRSSLHPWLETIFSISVLASAPLSEGAPPGPWMHCLLIAMLWLAPNGGYMDSTCQNLGSKAVPRLVGGSQAYDNGPMDPWPVHRDHWCKLT